MAIDYMWALSLPTDAFAVMAVRIGCQISACAQNTMADTDKVLEQWKERPLGPIAYTRFDLLRAYIKAEPDNKDYCQFCKQEPYHDR